MSLQAENELMLDCLARHRGGEAAAAVRPEEARQHLASMSWSYRRAAEILGCHSGHLTMVLTGRRESASLLARVMELGPAPEVPRTSTYAARKVAKRGDW